MILVVGMLFPLKWMISFHLKPAHLFPDFFGLWSAGLYAIRHASAGVYDAASLQAFQHGFGMPADLSYPFSYPPWLLLVLAPLSILPWKAAMGVWLAVTFSAFVAALAPWRWPPVAMALVLLTPATAVCFLVGQNGFLTAALILGGLRLLWTRPVLAGALLASAAYKPQFAILLPFVLLFGGHWRAMIGGALAVVTLSLASTLAFGPEIWGAWLAGLHQNAASMMGGRAALLTLMPTVTSTVLLLGGDITLAGLAQGLAVLAGLFTVWRLRRRRDPEAHAALALAILLAAPYAFEYDLPLVTGAALAVLAVRVKSGQGYRPLELTALLACVLAPAIVMARVGAVTAATPMIFALCLWVLARLPELGEAPQQPGTRAPARIPMLDLAGLRSFMRGDFRNARARYERVQN